MEYAYTLDPYKEPIKKVNKREVIELELENAFGGKPNNENELAALIEQSKHHPLTGPIYVDGVVAGNNIEIEILEIRPEKIAYQCCSRSSGVIKMDPFVRNYKEIVCDDGIINYGMFKMYALPSLGVVGTATQLRTRSGRLDHCGGNIDLNEVRVGSKLILPCEYDGALVYFGDMHLLQANGELSGIAAEVGGTILVSVDISQYTYDYPVIISEEAYTIIGYGEDINASMIKASNNAINFLQREIDISYIDAYMLLSLIGNISLGHSTGKIVSVGLNIPKYQMEKMRSSQGEIHL